VGPLGTEHIFLNHLLQKEHLNPLLNVRNEQIWPSVYLFVCLAILVLVKVNSFSRLVRVMQSTFSQQILQQLEREESNPFKSYSLALNVFSMLNLAFLAFKINVIYKFILVDSSNFLQYCFFLLIIFMVVFFKAVINRVLVVFTGERKLISEYNTSAMLLDQAFGILIFPWIVLMQFSTFDPIIFISGALIILAFSILLKWYRGVIMGLIDQRIGLLQIFSYFCGLEILPVFVLVKYLIQTF
jgi:hypothetical protein